MKAPSAVLFIVFVWSMMNTLQAQDLLVKKDSSQLRIRVVELDAQVLRYHLDSYPDGPVYVTDRKDIARIVYENGDVRVITSPAETTVRYHDANTPNEEDKAQATSEDARRLKKEEQAKKYLAKKNGVLYNPMAFMYGQLEFAYLRTFDDLPLQVYAPVSIGVAKMTVNRGGGFYERQLRPISVGIGVNYVTRQNRRFQLTMGPQVRWQQLEGQYYWQPGFSDPWGSLPAERYTATRLSFLANFGLQYRVMPWLSVMANAMIGAYVDNCRYEYSNNTSIRSNEAGADVYMSVGPCFHF